MVFRTAGAVATLLIGLGASGGEVLAQYYPPAPAYPPPQAYPPQQGYRELPPQGSHGYEPAGAGTRPYYGSPNPNSPSAATGPYEPDATRPPLPISPGQIGAGQGEPNAAGTVPAV